MKLQAGDEVPVLLECFPSPKGGGPIEAARTRSSGVPAPPAFHRRKAVAPLKHPSLCLVVTVQIPFHRRKAVAPLKLVQGGQDAVHNSAFHRRKAVAPLKQARHHGAGGGTGSFPSPKGGGPIEASSGVRTSRPCCSFHRRKAVAPLKRVEYGEVDVIYLRLSIAERRWPH